MRLLTQVNTTESNSAQLFSFKPLLYVADPAPDPASHTSSYKIFLIYSLHIFNASSMPR